ncbi:MAG: hypothetical protein HOV83_03580, partial [Catenulispora sp.]|nr:hypothetical protein [Catenulispora sp.]
GDNYLIQHVEAPSYEPDAPLRTSGSFQEEAALATSGNFTREAQQASPYSDLFREPAQFGTDDGMPLFRDEVPASGTHSAGARHGHSAEAPPAAAQNSVTGVDPYAGILGADPQTSATSSPFSADALRPAPFLSGFGTDPQTQAQAQPQSQAQSQTNAASSPYSTELQRSGNFPAEMQRSGGFPADPQANVSASAFSADALRPAPFVSGFGSESSPEAPASSRAFPAEPQAPSPFGAQAPPFLGEQQPSGFGAEPQSQPPAPFMTEAQLPQSAPPAWPNPAEPDPQRALAAWPPPDAAEPAVPPTLLVWPAPEPTAEQLLLAQGYAPTALKAPAQLQETGPSRPIALIADPVGVPVTRAALHTLRAAAADSGIPLFVTAGLGAVPAASVAANARRGADPSALLRALTPEQVASPRVLLLEENPDLAAAFAISLERDGMRVVQAASENDAMSALSAEHPQLVVMNLTLVRRRRSGVIEWLRAYERLHLAPTVLYTVPAGMVGDVELLHALRSGAAAVHLTDREVGQETANRLLDLMGKVSD